jgi:hypothetical protein
MVEKADDAIALWQQMVGEMQKGFRTFGDQLSRGSSEPRPAGSDSAQKRLADLMESYFAGMNLPSRAQLNGISDRLQAIESKLTDIKALLQEAVTNPKPAQEAPPPPQEAPLPPQDAPQPAQVAPPPQEAPQAASQPQPPRPPGPRPKRPAQAKSQPVPAGKGTSAVPRDVDKPE